ncbi:MAG TPA: uracil-DNA glycosylase family protein [Armatimonadota bacterium]|jgi:uracil-DNA glycosylase
MSTLTQILANIESEAKRAPFDIDKMAYRKAHRPPTVPILAAGNMESSLCLFARDLGQEEVLRGQPLIGSAGRRVRKALFERLYPKRHPDSPFYTAILNDVLLTNTVPYKPAGNVEYDRATKSRFRPYIEELLVNVWTGHALIPMGEGAFKWFAPYAEKGTVVAFWDDRENRFRGTLDVTVTAMDQGERTEKVITLAPIPHPSPRSPFMAEFPDRLAERLEAFLPK